MIDLDEIERQHPGARGLSDDEETILALVAELRASRADVDRLRKRTKEHQDRADRAYLKFYKDYEEAIRFKDLYESWILCAIRGAHEVWEGRR